jgi:hypothetical protein
MLAHDGGENCSGCRRNEAYASALAEGKNMELAAVGRERHEAVLPAAPAAGQRSDGR